MFHTNHSHEDHHHDSPLSSSPSHKSFPPLPPQHFQTRSAPFMVKRSMSFLGIESKCDMEVNGGGDDLSDDRSVQIGEKKKRLNMEQVKALEKSFEVGNRLESKRKLELAKALGLQPRQIAIWFQNRRARWKTKNLEKEYEYLKKQFEALKANNDALNLQNQKLHAEVTLGRKGYPTLHWGNLDMRERVFHGFAIPSIFIPQHNPISHSLYQRSCNSFSILK